MKRNLAMTILLAISIGAIAACKVKEAPDEAATSAQAVSDTVAQSGPPTAARVTGFAVESVPVTTAVLPPFPFFDTPEGLAGTVDAKDRTIAFDGQYFMAGDTPTLVEGKIFREAYSLVGERPYSETEFHRNYANAVAALGGKKISSSEYTEEAAAKAGGREAIEAHSHSAAAVPDYRHDTYLIRTPQKEYWIEVSTGSIPLHGYVVVLEKQAMSQSLGFLEAEQMKQALDSAGRVTLYINFDVDKATLRPEANAVLDEIGKLLKQNPDLRISIEGHTDNTGDAAHNRELSTSRARSVLGALVGFGIDPARLQSKGFGPDRPIADNATEEGRARNRRVELVKR
jgi:outer membrane protein OmpA-like peptidoglycan-associated protein